MKRIIIAAIFTFCCTGISAQPYTLEQCINMASENNTKIKNSRLEYEIADQTVKQAFTAYFPSVSATGLMFRSNDGMIQTDIDMTSIGQILQQMGMDPSQLGLPNPMPINLLDKGTMGVVSAVQPLFAGGQIVNSNKLSKIGREVAELQMRLSSDEVCMITEQYFWQIVALKEKLNTITAVESLLDEIHKNAETAVDAGLTMRNDLLRVEIQQQTVESNKVQICNGLTILKLLLCQYTGCDAPDFDITLDGFPKAELPSEYYIDSGEGVLRRIEVALLDKSVDAAHLQTRLEIGKNLPTVGVGAGYSYLDMMGKDYSFGVIFGSVSIPISSWWGGAHAIKSSKLKEEKAINTREENIALLQVDIESKWNDLNQAYTQIGIAEKTIASATENLRLTQNFYEAGTSAMTDLLDAQNLYQQSKDKFTDANVEYLQKRLAYLQATGRKQMHLR